MIIEIFVAFLVGILVGAITGITPGIHINMVAAILLGLYSLLLLPFQPIILVIFLVAMAISHTFIDYIPSIFLGAPDEDNFLSILPGHEMLIKGEAYSAVVYTLYGSLAGLIIILLLSPLFILYLPKIYPYAQQIMVFILLLTCFFLIYLEKKQRIWALIIFLLSGFLGIAALNLNLSDALLPLFTGLFGISSLLTSVIKKQAIPEQKITSLKSIKMSKKSLSKSLFASIIASPLCSFLPGLGSGQAAIIGSEISGELDRKEFLFLVGAVNIIVLGLSFITLYTINKYRTGIAANISKLTTLSITDVYTILGVMILAGIFAFFLTIFIAKIFTKFISKVNYQILSIIIIVLLSSLVYIFSGCLGILVLISSSALGFTCILLGIRRTHLMGCLLITALLFYI
jgi:putative membrane protein